MSKSSCPQPDEKSKKCSKCGLLKPLSNFHVRRASPDGLAYKCADCIKSFCREWREKNPGAFSRWHLANKERRAEYWRRWYEENKDHRSKSYKEWARRNPHIINALIAKRTAAKLKATPAWADLGAIRAVYAQASFLTKQTGVRHEVDHIVPLQGETVCGLHWEANLQILPKVENIRKSNRLHDEDGLSRPRDDCRQLSTDN